MPMYVKGEPVDLLGPNGERTRCRVVQPATAKYGRGAHVTIKVTAFKPHGDFKRFELVKAHPVRLANV